MPHDRLRKFNISDWFGQRIDWDGSMVVRYADELYLSGVNGSELDASRTHGTGHTPEDAAIQADVALNNLRTLLAEAGGSLDDICKINVYISDRAYRIPIYRSAAARHAAYAIAPLSLRQYALWRRAAADRLRFLPGRARRATHLSARPDRPEP